MMRQLFMIVQIKKRIELKQICGWCVNTRFLYLLNSGNSASDYVSTPLTVDRNDAIIIFIYYTILFSFKRIISRIYSSFQLYLARFFVKKRQFNGKITILQPLLVSNAII